MTIWWLLCIASATICGVIMDSKGRSILVGILVGALLGPFGILFALAEGKGKKECPECKEMMLYDAKVCPHCTRTYK